MSNSHKVWTNDVRHTCTENTQNSINARATVSPELLPSHALRRGRFLERKSMEPKRTDYREGSGAQKPPAGFSRPKKPVPYPAASNVRRLIRCVTVSPDY